MTAVRYSLPRLLSTSQITAANSPATPVKYGYAYPFLNMDDLPTLAFPPSLPNAMDNAPGLQHAAVFSLRNDPADQPFEVGAFGKVESDGVVGRLFQPSNDLCVPARVQGGVRDDFLEERWRQQA